MMVAVCIRALRQRLRQRRTAREVKQV